MSSPPQPNGNKKKIVVLGAGITGLSTTFSLLRSPHFPSSEYEITILAAHFPGDLSVEEYTSPWAGGHWRSHAVKIDGQEESEDENQKLLRGWEERTYRVWEQMLDSSVQKEEGEKEKREEFKEMMKDREKAYGLGFRPSRIFWGKDGLETTGRDGSGIWWRHTVRDFRVLDLAAEKAKVKGSVPNGAVFGIEYTSICINIPRYLDHLLEEITRLGAKVVKARVDLTNGLQGVVKSVTEVLHQQHPAVVAEGSSPPKIWALLNTTGLASRHFVSPEESTLLHPIRGQTLLIKGEARITQTLVDFPPSSRDTQPGDLLYVVPRPGSGTTILGDCKQVGSWDGEVDGELNGRILRGVGGWRGVFDESSGKGRELERDSVTNREDRDQEREVVSVQVGFRPGRKGGPRVGFADGGREEEEDGKEKRKVEGVLVLHSYGHGGGGYQCSVGCAERVVELLAGVRR